MQKAYDMVEWRALIAIMHDLGFPQLFTNWIQAIISTVSYTFNINGKLSPTLHAKRGIRQGDPISPLLFVIVMEYLNRSLNIMVDNPNFNYHAKCERMCLTNLIFADDVLLFSRGDEISVKMLLETVHMFADSTGLKINPKKCKVFCGGLSEAERRIMRNVTTFAEGQLPFRYLGVPISSKKLHVNHYLPLIERILQRMMHWTAKLLSYAGRVLLVKSVTTAITQYWMMCLPLPQSVIKKIDSLCRGFVWMGKTDKSRKSPVAWKTVCKPKKNGGIGLFNLAIWNKVALLKCLWNLNVKADNLWVKWTHEYYIKDSRVTEFVASPSSSWIMKGIMASKTLLDGNEHLWEDMTSKRKFKMKVFYEAAMADQTLVPWRVLMRRNLARPRARFFLWMACHEKIATKERLCRFNIVQDSVCSICNRDIEDQQHLFFVCNHTREIWKQVLSWAEIDHQPLNWKAELAWIMKEGRRKGWRASILKLAFTEACYGIWKFRNEKVFGKETNSDIVNNIIDCIVYRGWVSKKLRNHIANLMV